MTGKGKPHNYPATRRKPDPRTLCVATTKKTDRAGLRCGNVAFGWMFGGVVCLKHGADSPLIHDPLWRKFEEWRRLGPLTAEDPGYRLYIEKHFLAQEERWQNRAQKRLAKKLGISPNAFAFDPGTEQRPATFAALLAVERERLLRAFPHLASEPEALERYADQNARKRVEQNRQRRRKESPR